MKKQKQKSGFLSEHRFCIASFLYLTLYNYVIVTRLKLWKVESGGTFMHHIIDYKSLGFRSGLLPGSIFYSIFGSKASVTTATIYETVLLLLFFFGLSVALEKFMKRVRPQDRPAAAALVFLYLSGPFTFAAFSDTLGMLDAYFLYFSLIFFFIIENKVMRFLIPVIFALCLMTHMSAVLCCIILLSIILLYRISIEEDGKKKKTYTLIFALSMLVTAGLSVYFTVFVKEMPLTVEKFNEMLEGRGGTYLAYYDYTFYDYNIYNGTGLYPEELYSIESPLWRALRLAIQKVYFLHTEFVRVYTPNASQRILRYVAAVLLLSPPMYYYYRIMGRFFKSIEGNKLKKFSVFLMMVQFPFTVITGCLFSLDVIRWFTHAFIISLTMLLFVMDREEQVKTQTLQTVERVRHNPAALIYALSYFFVNFAAYT